MSDNVTQSIARHLEQSPFDRIRSELIDEVQKLTAHEWTDFNLHDPGVTILEQLAFALTDINYRSAYPVELLLANKADEIELQQHGMFAGADALVCRPVSSRDLQKALLNAIPELAYVNVCYSTELPGLIDVFVTPQDNHLAVVEKQVRAVYQRNRNLCEHLNHIYLIPGCDVRLQGEIEIEQNCLAEQVVASIHLSARRFLLGEPERVDYHDKAEQAGGLPFDGPRMTTHFISDDDLERAQKPRTVSALMEQLMMIDGVVSIRHLVIVETSTQAAKHYQHVLPAAKDFALYLQPPQLYFAEQRLTVMQQGHRVELDESRFQHECQTLVGQLKHFQATASIPNVETRLSAEYCELTDYSSVQSHFPSNYGINAFGVPSHSDAVRKAQARQLQGYLLLFDHLMSDHLHLLEHIKGQYSTDLTTARGYSASQISDSQAFNLQNLYNQSVKDDFLDAYWREKNTDASKTRVFDYLLALNGRDKTYYANELFNNKYTHEELKGEQLCLRQQQLLNVHSWSEHRAGGINLTQEPSVLNQSVLEKRLRLLLGAPQEPASLLPTDISALAEQSLPDSQLLEQAERLLDGLHYRQLHGEVLDPIDDDSVAVPVMNTDLAAARVSLVRYLKHSPESLHDCLPSLFQQGTRLVRYRVAQLYDRHSLDLVVNISPTETTVDWHYLGSFKDKLSCIQFANQLRAVVTDEAKRQDGFHLLENLLLLPKGTVELNPFEQQEFLLRHPFYCNQLTIVLPDYTLRNQRGRFRQYLDRQILQECPAHLHCHLLWLNRHEMAEFESDLRLWQLSLMQPEKSKGEQSAERLRDFVFSRLRDLCNEEG